MIFHLNKKKALSEIQILAILGTICLVLSVFRYYYSDTRVFLFLNWNLFLAFIPWAFSQYLLKRKKKSIFILLVLSTWLLFFPNAPYILTDLFHLRWTNSMPMWFDLLLILSFAWTGLIFGYLSLFNIEKILSQSVNPKHIPFMSSLLLFIASFGVYLGRYLRWNSWDIFSNPLGLFYDVGSRFIYPLEHTRTWGMTIMMGIFLNMVYWSFRLVKNKEIEIE